MLSKLKIVVNCGPCEAYIQRSLESIRSQTYPDWEAYITVDACTDRTYDRAAIVAATDRRIHVHRNERRLYSLANLILAIRRSQAEPDDVIVNLDGDDWFAHNRSLQIIADTYDRHDCWITYGSWISNAVVPGEKLGMWPAYPSHTTDFRRTKWLATAVRTWKKWIWDLIDDSDLRDSTGNYYRVSEDQAVMLPLLEMSTAVRARHIPQGIMVYNQMNPHASCYYMAAEMDRNAFHLGRQRPYRALGERPLTITDAASAGRSNAAFPDSPGSGSPPQDRPGA